MKVMVMLVTLFVVHINTAVTWWCMTLKTSNIIYAVFTNTQGSVGG